MAEGICIAGAGNDAGNTTLCPGLLRQFSAALSDGASCVKPPGQKTALVKGEQAGQRSWFVERAPVLNPVLEKADSFAASSGDTSRCRFCVRYVQCEETGIPGVPVLMVLDGVVGSAVDRFNLCSSMFRQYDVPVLGVDVSKILPAEMEKVQHLPGKWFEA
ncbi:hypothetical protein CSA37_05330 [Candidatus Fermentibacteria bacterium]|nr:MAG: hypothetical protein CSA37_05330 [Candidatus Fermentibacteria bacterium]